MEELIIDDVILSSNLVDRRHDLEAKLQELVARLWSSHGKQIGRSPQHVGLERNEVD